MRAAIYARRSTDEHQEASLDVQREEALRFAASKGWSVAAEHVFLEDAVSRAEFKKRPALIALSGPLWTIQGLCRPPGRQRRPKTTKVILGPSTKDTSVNFLWCQMPHTSSNFICFDLAHVMLKKWASCSTLGPANDPTP